jgi:Type II CAAX prenyl endopeptidase Rce1-like
MTARHRRILLGTAFVIGGGLLVSWIVPMVIRVHMPGVAYAIEIAAVLFALACAVRADGAAALGVQHRPVSAHVRTLASYVTGPILAFTVSLLVLSVLLGVAAIYWPDAVTAIRSLALTPRTPSTWEHVYWSVHAGICEEIVVIALAYRALEYLPPWRGRGFAATGAATVILVLLRLSYHVYYGIGVLAFIPMAWLTVRLYRRTRLVVPLIVGHISYDLLGLAHTFGGRILFLLVLAGIALLYLGVIEWRRQHASEPGTVADDRVTAGRLS